MANDVRIRVENPAPLRLSFDEKIILKYVSLNHADLDNLDYEHSGHTGFMPARLSVLPEVDENIQNGRLVLSVFNTEENKTSKISLDELSKRIIKTSSVDDEIIYKGQFIFKEIN